MKKILPVGSVVYLHEGTTPLVIIAIAQFVKKAESDEKLTYFDYVGSIYPHGFGEENSFYFNQENIAEVVFTGYESEQHNRYLQAIEEWKEKNADSFELGNVE
jgi:hypothetical protein